jgi:polyisoprenoid-binding protein YceI
MNSVNTGNEVRDNDLTVRGVTRPVPLRFEVNGFASDPGGEIRASFSAAGEINRIEFGVCTNPPIAGAGQRKGPPRHRGWGSTPQGAGVRTWVPVPCPAR